MERELWLRIRALATEVCESIEHPCVQFSDRWIVLVYAWAVIHDRPTYWACQLTNWPVDLRPARLPSQPTMSRRLRTGHVQWALAVMMDQLGDEPPPGDDGGGSSTSSGQGLVKSIDGKPLPVGGFSKDHDARRGHGAGQKFRGYKLHALWGLGPVPIAWDVCSAERSEPVEAQRLVPCLRDYGYVLGDAAYDSNALYDLAIEAGHQLIAPKKRPGSGLGHGPQSEHRLHGLALLETPLGQRLYAKRSEIERRFGNLTSFGGGLSGLPAWVRGIRRVGMWVEMKLILNGLRSIYQLRVSA